MDTQTIHTESSLKHADPRWIGVFNDRIIPLPRQKLPVSLMRVLASVPGDHVIVRDHESSEDEVLDDGSTVDLGIGNVFRIVPRCDVGLPPSCKSPAKKALSVDDSERVRQRLRELTEFAPEHLSAAAPQPVPRTEPVAPPAAEAAPP